MKAWILPFTLTFVSQLVISSAIRPQFNNSKCPSFRELQAPGLESFKLRQIEGFYYELALHDSTQFPLCPSKPRCITANKTVDSHSDGVEYVKDEWNLFCLGKHYPQVLLFNATENPGYMRGYVPEVAIPFLPKDIAANTVFPDTVVDFEAGPNGWVIEFQCVEWLDRVVFIGINFYSRQNTEEAFNEMYAAGKARGLDFYWNQNFGLHRVDFTDCPGA